MSVWAVILAAGSGRRMGVRHSKTLIEIAGVPAISLAVQAFREACDGILLVVRMEERFLFEQTLAACGLEIEGFCPGGKNRLESVKNALGCLPETCDTVLIHDGARPLVSQELVGRVLTSALERGSGVPSLPLTDTVKEVDGRGLAVKTIDRDALRAVQTPQGFNRARLLEAMEKAEGSVTDDAGLLEKAGIPVYLVPGEGDNIKLTVPGDIAQAERILLSAHPQRVGIGYDAHRLVPGRPLVIGGVTLPFEKGLMGHSDADVAVHALIDALLGACALGDIGTHFPDADEGLRGVSSLELLKRTKNLLATEGYHPSSVDMTVVAQQPRLKAHVPLMRQKIASALSLSPDAVSVKATTSEGMGFEGREEGISAHAVAVVARLRVSEGRGRGL